MILKNCRSCHGNNLKLVVSLGFSPLANNLLNSLDEADDLYPLDVMFCEDCHYSQLSYVVPPEKMFDTYLYVSSTTKTFRDHFEKAARGYITEFSLTPESTVVDIGSNDGVALLPLKQAGVKVVGVEPAVNIAKLANDKGVETINSYFDSRAAKEILEKFGKVDLVTASNVFAHSDVIEDITRDVFSILKENGCFVIEAQYLVDTVKDMTFDNIYHEHVSYWTVTSLKNFFERLGLVVVKSEHIDTHGGSIRVYVRRPGCTVDPSVQSFLLSEKEFGVHEVSTYAEFFNRIKTVKENVIRNLSLLKKSGLKIAGYGSPAKATTALNYYGVGTNYIDYIVEDNAFKHNKFLPGVKIPIKPKSALIDDKPDVIVIMAWNFSEEIKRNNKGLIDSGVKFISIKELQERDVL